MDPWAECDSHLIDDDQVSLESRLEPDLDSTNSARCPLEEEVLEYCSSPGPSSPEESQTMPSTLDDFPLLFTSIRNESFELKPVQKKRRKRKQAATQLSTPAASHRRLDKGHVGRVRELTCDKNDDEEVWKEQIALLLQPADSDIDDSEDDKSTQTGTDVLTLWTQASESIAISTLDASRRRPAKGHVGRVRELTCDKNDDEEVCHVGRVRELTCDKNDDDEVWKEQIALLLQPADSDIDDSEDDKSTQTGTDVFSLWARASELMEPTPDRGAESDPLATRKALTPTELEEAVKATLSQAPLPSTEKEVILPNPYSKKPS